MIIFNNYEDDLCTYPSVKSYMSEEKLRKKAVGNDNSIHIYQKKKLNYQLAIRERNDLTENQIKLLELIEQKHSKVIFLDGPAGTSKTFISILAGLRALNNRKFAQLFYVRSIIESASKSIGSLPGELTNKFGPFLMPLQDKLDELLPKGDVDRLMSEDRIKGYPINYMRGASLNATYLVGDECQNMSRAELITLITRRGEFSKFVLCGDCSQSDLNGKSGFMGICKIFDNEESRAQGIYHFQFTKEDIVRSGLIRFILEKLGL